MILFRKFGIVKQERIINDMGDDIGDMADLWQFVIDLI